MITASLKTASIDKSKLYKNTKGEMILDIVLIETPNNQYGNDYMVVQGVNKLDRQNGVKGAILGNAKLFEKPAAATPPRQQASQQQEDDQVPF